LTQDQRADQEERSRDARERSDLDTHRPANEAPGVPSTFCAPRSQRMPV
jgi:hypothetical protein